MPTKSQDILRRYGVAVVAVAAALALKFMLAPYLSVDVPFLVFFMAVMVSAWYGGLGPGLLATALSELAVDYFFLEPRYSLFSGTFSQNIPLMMFLAEGALVSWLADRLRVARRRSDERKEQLDLLVDGARDYAIFMLDPDGLIVTWNAGANRITGYESREVVGQPTWRLYPEAEIAAHIPERDLHLARTQGRMAGEGWRVRKDDSRFWASTVITALLDDRGELRGFSVVTRDITDRKHAEEEIERHRQHLEELVRRRTEELEAVNRKLQAEALGHEQAAEQLLRTSQLLARSNQDLEQFASVASHDLQEPLRVISGFLQLLERRCRTKLDAEACEFIGFAVDGASRMQRLINDLLDYSRISTRGIDFAPTDCNEVLRLAQANLRASIEESRASIHCDSMPTVVADKGQLLRLFQNLLGNAIKYRGPEPPVIHVAAQPRDGQWQFSIRDNGIGIEPQYFDRIFVMFQRLHERNKYSGTGIGLAVCKRIVERHGGRIWVESQPGQGSTFHFTLTQPRD
jgi:PAS domain S-box-containing protein